MSQLIICEQANQPVEVRLIEHFVLLEADEGEIH